MLFIRVLVFLLTVLIPFAAAAQDGILGITTAWPRGPALALGQPLFIELEYASDAPVTFRVVGLAGGSVILSGQTTNILLPHPAGRHRAVAWFAHREPAAVDAIRVTANTETGSTERTFALSRYWAAGAETADAPPAWVVAHLARERDHINAAVERWADETPDVWGYLISLSLMGALPGYIVLQWLALSRLERVWGLVSGLPLMAMVPVGLFTLFALSQGSNLWPLLLIFTAPVACLYLLLLWGVFFGYRTLARA